MDSQLPPSQAVNAYDDNSFIRVDYNSRREQPADNTYRPIEKPVPDRGYNFKPMDLPSQAPVIAALPQQPLLLFQEFLPISLVERWVSYTNSWVSHLLQQHKAGTRTLKPWSRLLTWKPTSVAELYVWLAILIYMQIHIEPAIEDYWKVSKPQKIEPSHPVTKYISYDRFTQLSRHLRLFDFATIDQGPDMTFYGRTYSRVNAWSDHIQHTSTIFFLPGTSIAVDECMVRFLGRSLDTTTVPNKPTPTGFKV
ncbi:hypothetical protein AK830_g12695 [Neonectria ditissima]|uniref:PiggyBac transposable element-derived protein domain-containing protein n=1 Tax=Neonectria ditissima TaxID=78410 RepID=A0A0P7B2X6_9HYPO|nr:hypothetical protein AK830_g12695 [Neonectria ditissima]